MRYVQLHADDAIVVEERYSITVCPASDDQAEAVVVDSLRTGGETHVLSEGETFLVCEGFRLRFMFNAEGESVVGLEGTRRRRVVEGPGG